MERIVLFHSFILFVVITSTLCDGYSVNSTHQELSCGHQQAIRITSVFRIEPMYCGKDTSTCFWKNTTTFPERCSLDSLPQLIHKCNGNNSCSGVFSIFNDTMCCKSRTGTSDCQNLRRLDIHFDCVQDMEILDLDTNKEKSTERWLMIRASKKSDNLCECSVRSNTFYYYYCDTSMHSRNCTRPQYSSKQLNFTLHPNKFSSLLVNKTSKDGTLKVNCSCSPEDKRTTSTPNPLTTSNVETPISEKEKEKTGITEKEKEKTGITEKEKEKTDGSNTMVLIASAAGGGLLLFVTTVLVVCLCKKRQGAVKDSTATDSAVNNRQYFNNRNNDALDDDGYYNVLPQNINSNVPQEIDDTYHHIGYSQNRPVVNDVDDTYNHIGGLREDTSHRQAARNDHNLEEQAQGGNSYNDEATYTAVVKNVSGKVTGHRRVINEDEDDKTYAEVNKKK